MKYNNTTLLASSLGIDDSSLKALDEITLYIFNSSVVEFRTSAFHLLVVVDVFQFLLDGTEIRSITMLFLPALYH